MTRLRNSAKTRLIVLSSAALILLTAVVISIRHPRDPEFEGRRVSAWFDQLLSQDRDSNNVPVSYAAEGAFEQMTPDAVPFLTAKLKYNTLTDELLVRLKQNRLTARFARRVSSPTDRRLHAAACLRTMGPAASTARPALLEAWKQDPYKSVKMNSVYAMAFILNRNPPTRGVPISDWAAFESATIAQAATAVASRGQPRQVR